jgi:hypothetical protein
MARVWRDNGLTLVLLAIFMVTVVGQTVTGWHVYDADQRDHGQPTISFGGYLRTGHFVEAIFENWESEFLQMGLYVLLTATLFQRGSAESKDPDGHEATDDDPRAASGKPDAPWPVRRGGLALKLYEHSLSIALLLLFTLSFALHVAGGASAYNEEQLAHGGETISTLGYLATSQLWFESFQNWQSEFLSIVAIVVLSIVLRQKGSPESKSVAAPHRATGEG